MCCGQCLDFTLCHGHKYEEGYEGNTKSQAENHLMPEDVYVDTGLHSDWAEFSRLSYGYSEDELKELLKESYANLKNEQYDVPENIKLKSMKQVERLTLPDIPIAKIKVNNQANLFTDEEIAAIKEKNSSNVVIKPEEFNLGKLRFRTKETL